MSCLFGVLNPFLMVTGNIFMFRVKTRYLGPGLTRVLSRAFVRGASLEGQQDLSGGSGVKHRVPFGDWDVHEFRWAAGSS